ncbi:MAG: hypothetical protein A2046_14320 [Bacteroidetes bacterium GWA2_30_7]|nr:MAG: hypothetical protein A2046_14320 [Bacteroidetes bacterium GWA2_30_7]
MAKMIIRHKVTDFNRWQVAFKEMEDTRKLSGSSGAQVYRGQENPNEVLVISDWKTKEQAQQYTQSPDLKIALEKAGVISNPEITFTE